MYIYQILVTFVLSYLINLITMYLFWYAIVLLLNLYMNFWCNKCNFLFVLRLNLKSRWRYQPKTWQQKYYMHCLLLPINTTLNPWVLNTSIFITYHQLWTGASVKWTNNKPLEHELNRFNVQSGHKTLQYLQVYNITEQHMIVVNESKFLCSNMVQGLY